MIKVKGLQIGNLFRDKLTGELLSVTGLDEDTERIDFKVVNRGKYPLPDGWQAEPIPLTTEILDAVGFPRNIVKQSYHSKGGFDYDIRIQRVWLNQNQKKVMIDHIEFLHQLQNLYEIITGEELKISL